MRRSSGLRLRCWLCQADYGNGILSDAPGFGVDSEDAGNGDGG